MEKFQSFHRLDAKNIPWLCSAQRTFIFFIQIILLSWIFLFSPNLIAEEILEINLEEAEEIAVTNSVILASLKDRRDVFRMVSAEKWRNYLPRVGISYFGLKNNNTNQADSQYNDIRLQLNQLIYDGGESFLEIESAKLLELLNQEDWKINRNQILLDTKKAYFRQLANVNKKIVTESALLRAKKLKENSRLEANAGFLSPLKLIEVETKIRELEAMVLKVESSRQLAEIELKKQLNLPLDCKIVLRDSLLGDYVFFEPQKWKDQSNFYLSKSEFKKSKLAIENLKIKQEIAESYWKPKVFLGGYYGQNTNGPLPVRNEVFGFNIGLQTQLGSTTNQSSLSSGLQSDGTGIQRIPGYGPQFVGKGENAFNSSTFNLFDDLSYSRKIYEGKIALSDAMRNQRYLKLSLEAEIYKASEKLKENWQLLRIQNAKFFHTAEFWKTSILQYNEGYLTLDILVQAELDLLRSTNDVTDTLVSYLDSGFELCHRLGVEETELGFYKWEKGMGNSIVNELYKTKYFELEIKTK
ncbi:TolC family protein [Leptospira sp. 96542]|nr:TolC family protein [Leptospira sp. 96542]